MQKTLGGKRRVEREVITNAWCQCEPMGGVEQHESQENEEFQRNNYD